MINKMNINKNAISIIKALNDKGFEAFLVGGCVRDLILGRSPKDWDITTIATPEQILSVFKDYTIIEIGKAFGVVSIIIDHEPFEIATYRTESYTKESRCPSTLEFTYFLNEDLMRRDFTMNAIAYNVITNKFIDPFGGIVDILNKEIKFVGSVGLRIEEDELRILRYFRFISQLDFNVDNNQMRQIQDLISSITFNTVSKERIMTELSKLFQGDNVTKAIELMVKSGTLQIIIPEITSIVEHKHNSPYHLECWVGLSDTIMAHTLHVIREMEDIIEREDVDKDRKVILFLSALLHDIGKPNVEVIKENGSSTYIGHEIESSQMAKKILTDLRFSKKEIDSTCKLIEQHMDFSQIEKSKNIAKLRRFFGRSNIEDLRILSMADDKASVNIEKLRKGKSTTKSFDEVWIPLKEKFPIMLPTPIVSGNDIKCFNLVGVANKELLDKIYTNQISSNSISSKENLLKIAKGLISGLSKN